MIFVRFFDIITDLIEMI